MTDSFARLQARATLLRAHEQLDKTAASPAALGVFAGMPLAGLLGYWLGRRPSAEPIQALVPEKSSVPRPRLSLRRQYAQRLTDTLGSTAGNWWQRIRQRAAPLFGSAPAREP